MLYSRNTGKRHIYHASAKGPERARRITAADSARRGANHAWALGALSFELILLLLVAGPASEAAGSNIFGPRVPGSGVAFVANADGSAVCASYPCERVTILNPTTAQVSLSLGIESVESLQAETYYTDLLGISNPTTSTLTITSVTIADVHETRVGDIGSISVYYCSAQTDDPRASCAGVYTMSGPSGGPVFTAEDPLAPGATRCLELVGFAGPLAHPGDVISFTIQVSAR